MARKAVGPTKDQFLASLSGVYRSVAKEILATLSYPESTRGLLTHALALVAARIPDLRMTCPAAVARWESWENALPELHAKADALEGQSGFLPKSDPTKPNPWYNQHPAQVMLSFLHSDLAFCAPDGPTKFRINALRGMFLAAYAAERYANLRFEDLDTFCNEVRRIYAEKGAFRSYEHLIPGPDQRDTWLDVFDEVVRKRVSKPAYYGRNNTPGPFNWLWRLHALLRRLADAEWPPAVPVPKSGRSLPSLPATKLDLSEGAPSLNTEPDAGDLVTTALVAGTSRRRIGVATKYPATEEADTEALGPQRVSAVELASVSATEEVPIPQATALEARHTSWKTAREAQRLPWDWEQLNAIEIKICTDAVLAAAGEAEQLGAALAWFVLVTGQPLDAVLRFPWRSHELGGIFAKSMWLRVLPSPWKAFTPKGHHEGLVQHKAHVAFGLPLPLPGAIRRAIKASTPRKGHTVGKAFGVDAAGADAALRDFLGGIRFGSQRQARLQPGRLRRVLANIVMRMTQDKVLTYLVAGLPGEEPPTGVYYTAYPEMHLREAYTNAVRTMFP